MRRYLVGVGGLCLLGAAVQVLAGIGGTACNEPVPTSYGNPNILDRKSLPGEGGAEPLLCGAGDGGAGAGDGGCPSFATDIFPLFQGNGRWQCSSAACHGGASAPTITCNDEPTACLSSLKAIAIGGKTYLAEGNKDPNESTVMCNLQGACGSRMPKAPAPDPSPEELCRVEAWLKCGAPP